jgi:two-component system alkaline phosphatase synthesis response regulator PhoP
MDSYQFKGHIIDFNASEVLLASGQKITLTKRESLLLKLLIEHKQTVVTREKILQLVWGYQVFPNTRTIDNFILNFRKYFEIDPKHPKHFISMRGVGYKFQD